MLKKLFILIVGFCLFMQQGYAQRGLPQRPEPPKLVNDFAKILTEQQANYLERKLVDFNDTTGTQIVIVTVKDLAGNERGQFTYSILNSWGVGQAGKDNGVVIMVKPKTGQERGDAFIAQGKGLEGIMPDVTLKRVLENEMFPHFRNNDYFQGLNNGTDIIMGLAAQEFTAADYEGKKAPHPAVSILPLLMFLAFFILMAKARKRNSSLGHGVSFWTLLMLMNAGSRRHSGSWGNFTGGGGGFGGGGFGGFGGGRSGGGGAGGSW